MDRPPQYRSLLQHGAKPAENASHESENSPSARRRQLSGRLSHVALSFFILTGPMLAFTAVLLGLVFYYRVKHTDGPFPNLQNKEMHDEAGIYYVRLSATFLIFISSWSSSLGPLLVGFALALAAYPIARQLLRQARANNPRELLTPHELALTLKFLEGGGFGALWAWVKYLANPRQKRQPQATTLVSVASVTVVAVSLG
jgi:hypothetical protein